MSIEYADNITERPLHLDIEFLQSALENARLLEYPSIENVHLSLASNAGDNYCSNIYRAKITYFYQWHRSSLNSNNNVEGNQLMCTKNDRQTIDLIIKCIHNTKGTEFLNELRVFHKERIFYKFILPRLEMLLLQQQPSIRFGPSMYLEVRKPAPSLVFEDLGALKFQLGSREKGLDLKHAELVLQRLGQMHAASMILFDKMPELKVCFETGMLDKASLMKSNSLFMQIIKTNLEVLLETMEKWAGFESLIPKIQKYTDNLLQNLLNSGKRSQSKWKVLNHGDLWVNNVLFQYDKAGIDNNNNNNNNNQNGRGKIVKDLRFVDFQLGYWNSPGIDLNYFFHTSLEYDVLQTKRDYLLNVYHCSLCETLQRIGDYYKQPSLQDIHAEFNDYLMYGFYASYTILPLISMDKNISGDNSLENFGDPTFAKKKLRQTFTYKGLQEKLMYNLRQFEKARIFD